MAVKITEYQQQATKIKEETMGESHPPIGFAIIEEEEEEDEESDD